MSNVIQFNDDQAIEDGKVLAYRMQEIIHQHVGSHPFELTDKDGFSFASRNHRSGLAWLS